ncbi:MAG: hypothetical protein K0U78_00895 [Actinomycetia bacterium]|nr:hypothetical protein [Actinomycetes bacterium]
MQTIATTSDEVIVHLAVSDPARRALASWLKSRPQVAEYVLSHETRVPYTTSLADLQYVAEHTDHALGHVSKDQISKVTSIRDWNPPFAMTHVLHYALETIGGPFTYQDFQEFCNNNSKARSMLTNPSLEAVETAAVLHGRPLARMAMKWRVGNSYYSFLRELITLASLREVGIDLRIHPLADALFRTDAWTKNCIVSLYIGNSQFRNGNRGRKPQPKELLGSSFRYLSLELPTQHIFGSVHVPDENRLCAAAQEIRHTLERYCAA